MLNITFLKVNSIEMLRFHNLFHKINEQMNLKFLLVYLDTLYTKSLSCDMKPYRNLPWNIFFPAGAVQVETDVAVHAGLLTVAGAVLAVLGVEGCRLRRRSSAPG